MVATECLKISLIGKSGKMGKALTALIAEDPDIELSEQGDVLIDFSHPEGTKKAIAAGKPLVCGTTGLSEAIMQELHFLSQKVPVLYSPNFSLGMALCFEIVEALKMKTQFFNHIEIEETHHLQKADSPSGTAKKLGELLDVHTISSKRCKDVVGIHQIDFFLADEKICLRHEAASRLAFAKGALAAAKFIHERPAKFYSLKDLFL